MLTPVLKAAGYDVTAGRRRPTRRSALLQGGRRFDVVVTDIEMPGMDGFELAAAVRGDPRTADLPIIALSVAGLGRGDRARPRRSGFHDYVAKFDRQGLIAALKEQTADLSCGGMRRSAMTRRRSENIVEYVTATIGGQLFGLPISRVQDVFMPERLTRVPLAPPEIAGVLNLRGRIVTAIDMRRRLGLPHARATAAASMAVGIEHKGESYGLLIDAVGEVLKLPASEPRGQSGQSRRAAGARLGRRASGSTGSCWSFSTSTACSTSAQRADRGVRPTAGELRVRCGGAPRVRRARAAMKTCLVVDDSSVIRKVARRILEGLDFQIVEAEDGEQALDACRGEMPDAVLLDWNMPKMDGYEFLRALRRLPGRRSAEGGVLHHRERRRAHRPRAACRRQRIHHEAVRQGDRRGQVPGSRADLIGRPAVRARS